MVEYCRDAQQGPAAARTQGYGDWLSINADTPKDVICTAYFAYSTELTAEAAACSARQDDARSTRPSSRTSRRRSTRPTWRADGRIKGNTQTCYVHGPVLRSAAARKSATGRAKYLVETSRRATTHLSTGFIGTGLLMPILAEIGQPDVAYRLLLNDTYPSWGYSIKHGATSIWERWDGWTAEKGFQDPGMNSFAHYSFGAVARWMFQSVAGIDTDGPGYQRLDPPSAARPGLSWVKASYRSLHGPDRHGVEDAAPDGLVLDLTVPANTHGHGLDPGRKPQPGHRGRGRGLTVPAG